MTVALQKLFVSKKELVKLYLHEGKSTNDIGKIYDVSDWAVVYRLRKYNIPGRTLKEAIKLAVLQGKYKAHGDRSGVNSRNWKGGRKKEKEGYTRAYSPDHPRAVTGKYVMEHIIIWEEVNKCLLPKGWVIHHFNGIKNDNRIENLLALPDRTHRRVISGLQRKIKELEEQLAYKGRA